MSRVSLEPLTPERRRAMTRAHLLAAAAEVFAERGYHGATLDQVAEKAGFTKGAVYSNFASKADLFLALSAQRERQLIDAFASAAPTDGSAADVVTGLGAVYAGSTIEERERSWRLWQEFVLFSLREPSARQKLIDEQRNNFAAVVDLAREQCKALDIEPPVPVELLARMWVALFTGFWQQQTIDPDAVGDDAFPTAVAFLTDALATLGRRAGNQDA